MAAESDLPADLTIRPPLQRRSREGWERILNAGVALLEDEGYDGFTIAALCERADVPPRALYARADTKDALFLAVYDHGMARLRADYDLLTGAADWSSISPEDAVAQIVQGLVQFFDQHARLLRSVVLISGMHPEVTRRGSLYSQELSGIVCSLLRQTGAGSNQPDPDLAVRAAFNAIFSTLVFRIAYGPDFTTVGLTRDAFVDSLSAMVGGYLK
ncbi:TetR/AcrR family transcriptional regulator [Gordonia sp. NPDC003424]